MTTAAAIITLAAQIGIKASVWQKGDKLRIYAKTQRKDISAYLECDGTPDEIEGAAFKVFCNTPQHANWVAAQVRENRERYIGLFHAYVFEMYAETGPQPNGYGPDINAMIDESRIFIAQANEAE